jgi:Fungal protein kinase
VSVLPFGIEISKIRLGYLQLFNDARGIHHRNLTPATFRYYMGSGGPVGVLTGFEYAVEKDNSLTTSTSRVGTSAFMATRLLNGRDQRQELVHDFESSLYVLIWMAVGYRDWKPPHKGCKLLARWTVGTWGAIASDKADLITKYEYYDRCIDGVLPQYRSLCPIISDLVDVIYQNISSKNMQRRLGGRIKPPKVEEFTQGLFLQIIGAE